jgi:hypothetical protein
MRAHCQNRLEKVHAAIETLTEGCDEETSMEQYVQLAHTMFGPGEALRIMAAGSSKSDLQDLVHSTTARMGADEFGTVVAEYVEGKLETTKWPAHVWLADIVRKSAESHRVRAYITAEDKTSDAEAILDGILQDDAKALVQHGSALLARGLRGLQMKGAYVDAVCNKVKPERMPDCVPAEMRVDLGFGVVSDD